MISVRSGLLTADLQAETASGWGVGVAGGTAADVLTAAMQRTVGDLVTVTGNTEQTCLFLLRVDLIY